jgi:hypothetical protein
MEGYMSTGCRQVEGRNASNDEEFIQGTVSKRKKFRSIRQAAGY